MKHLKVQNSEKESSLAALKSRLDKTVRLYRECDIEVEGSGRSSCSITLCLTFFFSEHPKISDNVLCQKKTTN